jgi:hypothetical protein
MDTAVAWVLGVATILGGIAAILYFRDKWKDRNRFTEEEKEVTSDWWEASDVKKDYEVNGFRSFGWSNSDRVAERQVEGAEVIYLIDGARRVKFRLVNRSGQVLIGRKGT